MGVCVVNHENRIFSWKGIPRSSRIIIITTMIIVVLITPNLAEGYYESSWEQVEKSSENNYNSAIIDENGDAWVFGDNGEIVLGNNQESAAYPSGMCAERVAIWKAGSMYPEMIIKKLAISASSVTSTVDKPVGPCGACRQTLSEYEINQKSPFPVIFMGEVGEVVKTESLLSLLPFSFDSSYL